MRFAPRIAVLAAAIGIPLGAVVATYALAGEEPGPTIPAEVRIGESVLPREPAPQLPTQPAPPPPQDQAPVEVVPPPPPVVGNDDEGYQGDDDDGDDGYQDDDDD